MLEHTASLMSLQSISTSRRDPCLLEFFVEKPSSTGKNGIRQVWLLTLRCSALENPFWHARHINFLSGAVVSILKICEGEEVETYAIVGKDLWGVGLLMRARIYILQRPNWGIWAIWAGLNYRS